MEVTLRFIKEEDLEIIRNWRNSEDVNRYMYSDDIITKEQQLRWYEKIRIDESKKYWIIMSGNEEVGLASISDINYLFSSCFWSFYLGGEASRGGGIGSKVEWLVIQHVFQEMNLNKLRCEVLSSNERVIQLHEKFGFRREAYYRQHVAKRGKFHDVVGLGLLKREWREIEASIKRKLFR